MVVDFVTDIKDITKEILGNTTGLTDKELNKKLKKILIITENLKIRRLPKYFGETYVCR